MKAFHSFGGYSRGIAVDLEHGVEFQAQHIHQADGFVLRVAGHSPLQRSPGMSRGVDLQKLLIYDEDFVYRR